MKKQAVTILLFNESGLLLAVSRKNDPNDMGLPGGKVDEGEKPAEAIVREVKEETGLDVSNIRPYFIRQDDEYLCITYTGEYSGEISSKETGVIKWTTFDEIKQGSFGKYNAELEEFHKSMKS